MNFLKYPLLLSASLFLGIQGTGAMEHDELPSNAILIKKVENLEKTVQELQLQVKQLTKENYELQDKLNPSRRLKAKFSSNVGWKPYPNTQWAAVEFNVFEGNGLKRNQENPSAIDIPEDGTYLLSAEYYWGARGGNTQTRTAIAINYPENISNDWHHHNLPQGTDIKNGIRRQTLLKKGDKVMVSIQGSPNANIFLGHFEFNVEKLP